ncbi:MAG: phosphoglucosamine mutase [Pyrinomonadaceae bacterium]
MARLFGTDGIRGEAGSFPLDAATVRRIGYSLASHLANRVDKHPFIIIGRDTRESGEWIEKALTAGARSAGARCDSAGVITTPGVAFLTRSQQADAGIVISASHNPYQDNGIKIFEPSGRKLKDATERLIEADIHAGMKASVGEDSTETNRQPIDEEFSAEKLRHLYRQYLTEEIGRGLSLEGLTLVLDCANGAASSIAPELFRQLGARVIAINNIPDGRNINHNCGSLFIDGLRERTVVEAADLGVAFDGDADRALFVDSQGGFVDGDATLWILAQHLKTRGGLRDNTVIATVMSNIGLEIALERIDVRLVRTDVGDKYVLEELTRTGAAIGGEQSGHIILPQLSLAGDGIITTLCLLRAVQESHQKVAELVAGFQRFPQVLVNVSVRTKRPFEELPEVANLATQTKERLGAKGRLLLRYSGTEALARVMIEGENQTEIDAYARALAETISNSLGTAS